MGRLMGMAFLMCGSVWAATYTVTNTNDAGAGSLRWAMSQANGSSGSDRIDFAAGLKGSTIKPLAPLPILTDSATTIMGDIDLDGRPDIGINGAALPALVNGIEIHGAQCTVRGLAVYNCPAAGIALFSAEDCVVRTCYVGTNLGGRLPKPNGTCDIHLLAADHNTIGGSAAAARNVIAGGQYGPPLTLGIRLEGADRNSIVGNYIGLQANGGAALGSGGHGIYLMKLGDDACEANRIGGSLPGQGNLFGGLASGIFMQNEAARNVIAGNWFGLGKDGSTSIPVAENGACVHLDGGCHHNTVGGASPGARNVFAGNAGVGVTASGAGTSANCVRGNYFGMNAAGTAQRPLVICVRLTYGAGWHTLGGDTAAEGNYFANQSATVLTASLYFDGAGASTTVRHNTFGVLPSGADVTAPAGAAVHVRGVRVLIKDNVIANSGNGILALSSGTTGDVRAFGNHLRGCTNAVRLCLNGTGNLGNLGNASTSDDGGNVFGSDNTCYVYNETPAGVKAEGNDFGTTSKAAIDAKITDKRDNPSFGRVDFIPLAGGVIPTGDAEPAALTVTAATAVPSAAGAEIAFGLSAPAEVTVRVLNIAGRPVRTLVAERPLAGGVQTLLWNRRSDAGLPAPSGRYLIRITARSGDGSQSTALATVALH